MNTKTILLAILFLLPFVASSQQTDQEYIKATAVIKKIEKKRSGRGVKEIATVAFATQKGDSIKTTVELGRIPFLGSFKSAGDKITINYNKKTPALAETNMGNFLSKYGMYILILLGVLYSAKDYIKARKKNK